MPPWAHGTYNGLQGTSSSREEREKGYGEGTREGQAGRRRALTSSVLPPCSCKAFCRSSTWARSSNSCCWFSLQECGVAECLRPPSAPHHTPPPCARAGRGGPPPGGSSPQLRLQPVARAVGVLQVALQLLLPLPVGRLLLAQLLVLQLKPQERLPADRQGVSRAGDGSPRRPAGALAGRLGGQGWQRDRALGKSPTRPRGRIRVMRTQRWGTKNGRGFEVGLRVEAGKGGATGAG